MEAMMWQGMGDDRISSELDETFSAKKVEFHQTLHDRNAPVNFTYLLTFNCIN